MGFEARREDESCEAGNLDEAARTGEELAKVIDLLP